MADQTPKVYVAETNRHDGRQLIVFALYGLAAFGGVVQAKSTNGLVATLCSLLFAALAASWCVVDARLRDHSLMPVVQMIMFLTWPLAVPIYLIASRKWRGLVYILLHGLGMYLAGVMSGFVASYF